MLETVIVNASHVLTDAAVSGWVPTIQTAYDKMLAPSWGLEPCKYSFMSGQLPQADDPRRFIFVNRHSLDPGALGWHDFQNNRVFGRIFAKDCLDFGIDPLIDTTHEAWEQAVDPFVNRYWQMPDGRWTIEEASDAVEADEQGIPIELEGVTRRVSNFVLRPYFSANDPGPFDFGATLAGRAPRLILTGRAPHLTPGGYLPVYTPQRGWGQVTERRTGGGMSYRAQRWDHGLRIPREYPEPLVLEA